MNKQKQDNPIIDLRSVETNFGFRSAYGVLYELYILFGIENIALALREIDSHEKKYPSKDIAPENKDD